MTFEEAKAVLESNGQGHVLRFWDKLDATGQAALLAQIATLDFAAIGRMQAMLKDAGLIQGEIEAPKVKYCINRENWEIARRMFADFFGQPLCKKEGCCR